MPQAAARHGPSIPARRRAPLTASLLAVAALGGVAAASAIPAAEPPAEWRARYVAGTPPVDPGTTLQVSITDGGVVATHHGAEYFSIPAGSILGIAYDDTRASPSATGWVGAAMVSISAEDDIEAFVPAFAVMAAGSLILSSIRTTSHLVQIDWLHDGTPRDVVLRVDAGDRLAVLNALATLAGRPWEDRPEMRRNLLRRFEAGEGDWFDIHLPKDARIPGGRIDRGDYRMVALPSADGQSASILFFEGRETEVNAIAGQAVALIEPGSPGTDPPVATWGAEPGDPEEDLLAAVITASATYRLWRPYAPEEAGDAPGSEPPGRRLAVGGGLYLTAILAGHEGERSLRLDVIRHSFPIAPGVLHLSRDRLRFEPLQGDDIPGTGPEVVTIPREDVLDLAQGTRMRTAVLRVETADDTVIFLPVFDGDAGGDGPGWEERNEAAREFFSWVAACWRDFPACEADLAGDGTTAEP